MDPIDASARWNAWSATGTPEQLGAMLDHLDAHLPAGWRRLPDVGTRAHRAPTARAVRWYELAPAPTHAGVAAGLTQQRESEVRGDWISWLFDEAVPSPTPAGEVGAWVRVMHLLDNAIGPAARATGATFRAPTVGELFLAELSWDMRDRLRQFSDSARKTLPLSWEESERWREFVLAAYRTGPAIDSRQFIGWLVAQGWGQTASEELEQRFLADTLLLSRYDDAGRGR